MHLLSFRSSHGDDLLLSSFFRWWGQKSWCMVQRVKVGGRWALRGQTVLRLLLRVEAEEGGTGKGHFLEGHGFEGRCVRRSRSFYVEKEAVESEGREDEQRVGWDTGPECTREEWEGVLSWWQVRRDWAG